MKALSTEIRALIASRLESSSPVELLRIASAIAANEQIEAVSQAAALSSPRGLASTDSPRFVKIDGNGKPTDAEHVAVHDRRTGLTWSRALVGTGLTHAEAMKVAANFKPFGQGWRAPTIEERQSIIDYAKHSPALDTEYFAKESGWEWTSTLDAESPSDCAWYVYLGAGSCSRGYLGNRGFVRAVLAGQQFSLSF
jgi:hypothetical protein